MIYQYSKEAAIELQNMSEEIGKGWCKYMRRDGVMDELLQCIIADGTFTTKMDGLIHAAHVTTPIILKYGEEVNEGRKKVGLGIDIVTSWESVNAAVRYGIWQTDFHWKIDTRYWQYLLLMKHMRLAYAEAITNSDKLTETDKESLIRLCEDFYDVVEVVYAYRNEIIERSRGFAKHPDETAGSKDRGYTYRVLVEPKPIKFSQLKIDFIGTELGAGTAPEEEHVIPEAWPRLEGQVEGVLAEGAKKWVRISKEEGLSDTYLRTKLGDRMVPTRFNGWEESLKMIKNTVITYSNHEKANVTEQLDGYDLTDFAVRFGLTQSVFYERLDGTKDDLITFLNLSKEPLHYLLKDDVEADKKIDRFIDKAAETIEAYFANPVEITIEVLPELEATRPVHPRFAPYDPVEPLPWETKNVERYIKRMEKLGYTI